MLGVDHDRDRRLYAIQNAKFFRLSMLDPGMPRKTETQRARGNCRSRGNRKRSPSALLIDDFHRCLDYSELGI